MPPQKSPQTEEAVDALINSVGLKLVVATPLGVGKPNHFLNSLYKRAKENPKLNLTILTALTLQKPEGKSDLEKRFMGPLAERVFGNYVELDYEKDRVKGQLSPNVSVIEFYLQPGKHLNDSHTQRNYLSSNYTHVARDILDRGVNVVCQQICKGEIDGFEVMSLSCNPEITIDLVEEMRKRSENVMVIGQTNQNLPFMYGESIVSPDFFDLVIDNRELDFTVFGPPKMSISATDYMIGLHASALIKDDGEIQIGIGSLADALTYSLIQRERHNLQYKNILQKLKIDDKSFPALSQCGSLDTFEKGLFAPTEMFVDSFSHLYKEKILKKKVYDSVILQRLLNEGKISEHFDEKIIDQLLEAKAIHYDLNNEDVAFLKDFGIFKRSIQYKDGQIILESGESISTNLLDEKTRQKIIEKALGRSLRNGAVAHAGFFVGPQAFYNFLRELPVDERKLIRMKRIRNINHLYGHEEIDRLQRKNARFLNTCMKISLNGAASSDALENNLQVSGVGGQYNFVAMAHELPDARSIIQLRSWRTNKKGKAISNIVYNYANCTIPRHLRDIVITEYGIAELRGKTDEEVAISLIHIADSRFQEGLLRQAKDYGKVRKDYELPRRFAHNNPEAYSTVIADFKEAGFFPAFPLGCDFTEEEIKIGKALKYLKRLKRYRFQLFMFIIKSLFTSKEQDAYTNLLKRMKLDTPNCIKEKMYRRILLQAFAEVLSRE
jgi:acyl-CoA hydrolase